MEALRATARNKYNEWFPAVAAIQPPALVGMGQVPTRPVVNFVIGGYDGDEPKLFHLLAYWDFAPMLSDYGWAVEGVAQYALYLLNRLYEPDRTVQDLTALAVYAITETASQDGKVGGPVKVITVKPAEGCTALPQDAVDEVIAHNEERARELRASFYEETQ